MMREVLVIFISFSLVQITLNGQDVPIGQWKSYAPYHNAVSITQNADYIFFGSELSIIQLAKNGTSVDFLSKENGLSDADIAIVKHSPTKDALLIVYSNSNIDLIKEGQVINLNAIQTNANLTGDRSINDIWFQGDIAYLSTAFGVVALDIERAEFRTTTFTNDIVESVAVFNNFLYAATPSGLYRISTNNNNIADFGQWSLVDQSLGFPADYSAGKMALFNEDLYIDIDEELFRYDGSTLDPIYNLSGFNLQYLSTGNSHLIVGFECINNCNSQVVFVDDSDNVTQAGNGCAARSLGAIQVNQEIYFADLFSDLRKASSIGADCNQFSFSSPASSNVSDIETDGDKIYIAAGGRTDNGNNIDLADGVFYFENGNWASYNEFNVAEFVEQGANRDFINIAFHPDNDKVYIANYYGGLLELDNEKWTVFNASNSSLQGVVGFEERVRVGSIDFDSQGNLWMTNHLAERPISVLMVDGSWKNFDIPGSAAVKDIRVDEFDNKWITIYGNSQGIVVFNEGDINVSGDHQYKTINANNSELTTNQVNYIEVDLDGTVWAGTGEGVITFECGSNIFQESCRGTQRIVDVGSNRDLLLRTENVQTIGVDGGNRKWFGTTNGIFVQSADGEEEIFRFNTDNSPLYSNNIVDFAFDYQSGEVFIATSAGVQSYRSNATKGTSLHISKAEVFPNPVRPEYRGDIGISGLARDANVKITDIKGQLVFETRANGGTAIWNGRDFNGRRVATGVYLIYSTVQDDFGKTDALAGKVLFVN